MCSCYLVLPNKIRRKGEILHKHTKNKSTEYGLLLRKILSHIILNPPPPIIFNSTFQKYFSWKFYSDLIQISDFKVKEFESPRGTDFSWKSRKIFLAKFHSDFVTISKFVHNLFCGLFWSSSVPAHAMVQHNMTL